MTGQRVGRYEVLTRLTMGGMAELSLASTAGPGGFRKFVVLKRILPEAAGDENFVKMFLDEARVTGAFSHPAICQVFELGNDKESGLFVAMEFIAGQDLNQVVAACARQQAVLPIGFSSSVLQECALALHYAHTFKLPNGEDQTVIHRDVAQKNIMVTYDGQVKLLDFGIAKAKGALARTRAGTVKGTAGYMSPEQVRGEQIDPRSDVFGLGVVLWEMVTGRRLFSAETELLELKMILSEPIVPPHEVEPSVPRELSDVAMKALERDLAHRFKSAREMARALSQTCGHLLFDAEERAHFMKQRFSEKIEAAQRLFDVAGSKDESEVGRAVEDFRRSSQHEQKPAPEPPLPKRPALSANKLKAARGPGQVSAKNLKKVPAKAQRYGRGDESTESEGQPLGARQAQAEAQKVIKSAGSLAGVMTEAMVPTYEPPSSSKVWPILAVVFALVVGAVVWKLMQVPPAQPQPAIGALPGTDLPGTDLPGTNLPGTDSPRDPNPPKDPVVRPTVQKQQGEVTLALIPEATVSKGATRLGQGSLISFSLPVGTHLVTIKGDDGVRRKLSLQVGAGKNKAQRYRLEDLPPE